MARTQGFKGFVRPTPQLKIPEFRVNSLDEAKTFWGNLKATRNMLTSASERLAMLRKSLYQELASEENLDDEVVKVLLEDMKKRDKVGIRPIEKVQQV